MGAELEVRIADYWYPVVPYNDSDIHARINHRHVYRLKKPGSTELNPLILNWMMGVKMEVKLGGIWIDLYPYTPIRESLVKKYHWPIRIKPRSTVPGVEDGGQA